MVAGDTERVERRGIDPDRQGLIPDSVTNGRVLAGRSSCVL